MLRSLSLLGLTALSAAGIAGSIHAQLPQQAFTAPGGPTAAADRIDEMQRQLAITPAQRPVWRAFAAAVAQMRDARRVPAGDMFASLAKLPATTDAGLAAATRLRDAASRLDLTLTPVQRARARALWSQGPAL